jgi:hypothetical protein
MSLNMLAQNALPVIQNLMAGSYGTWLLRVSQASQPSLSHVDLYRPRGSRNGFSYGAWMIIDTLAFGNPVRGYPSLLVSFCSLEAFS